MKRVLFLIIFASSTTWIMAQGGWKRVTDQNNPVVNFTSPGTYKGAAWVDINNDGNVDLFAMPNFMFLNNGDGNFTKLDSLNILSNQLQLPGGCSWGDINNDGFIDLIIAQNPTEIYFNKGDNTFQNISAMIPSLTGYASWGCALADINNDNKLDLLYVHANGFHGSATSLPCKLFMQDTNAFGFTQKTGYYFTDFLKPYTVPYFNDYDLDGDMDLFIASGPGGSPGPDYCYKNMKKETGIDTLYKMTTEPWSNQMQDGQCYNFIDYDNDGDLDMCLTNYGGAIDRFYKKTGTSYTSLTTAFTNIVPNLSNSWGDFDNDGDLDVIIASDNTTSKYYKNNGDGTFSPLPLSIAAEAGSSCIISCDYDNDGDLDVFIHGTNNARSLYENDTVASTRTWISFSLKGVISNTSAIGAIVKIKSVINGNPVWQMRTITSQNSFQGQNDLRQHFGLNDALMVDSLIIWWPSGIKEFYTNIPSNQFKTLIEGNGTLLSLKKNNEDSIFKVYPNPSDGIITVSIFDENNIIHNPSVKIVAMTGKVVYDRIMQKNIQEINLKDAKPGTYIVVVNIQDSAYFSKVVITR